MTPLRPVPRADDHLEARLARGAAAALAVNVAGVGLAVLAQLVLARALGAEGYGVYAYVFAWVGLLVLLATLGFETALLRFVPDYRARRAWGALKGVVRHAERRTLAAGVALAAVGVPAALLLLGPERPKLAVTFCIGLAAVPVAALLRVRGSTVRGFGHPAVALAADVPVREATILLAVGVVVSAPAATGALDASAAMAAMLLGTGFGLAAVSVARHRLCLRRVPAVAPWADGAGWSRVAAGLLLIAGMNLALRRVDILLVGALLGTTEAGAYAVAVYAADLAALPLLAVNAIFAPTIAALYGAGERERLRHLVTATARWGAAAALAIAAPLFVLAPWLLALFGHEFVAAADALRIVLAGNLARALAGSVVLLMTLTGHERQAAAVFAAAVAASLALNAVLIPAFGLVGAASATALTMIGWSAALAVLVRANLSLVPGVFGRRRPEGAGGAAD
ncbi:MAG TPA: lipopolysaccharide biosynthesis protein [Geminicoccaceae bacterium]|nr:lipopolysaccharide biosynthesis protein [Geminicoccaceae bacterium]